MARHVINADITGTVFKIETSVGAAVAADSTLIVLESMKMEISIPAPSSGKIHEVAVQQGVPVSAGQHLLSLIES